MRSIVICTTCKHSDGQKVDESGLTAGQHLVKAVRQVLADRTRGDVQVQEQACLWNCTRPCSVVLRDDDRFSYVTGGNAPTCEQAEAILAWFDLHGESETGEVPFRQWPALMRGHFIARMPPVKS